MLLDALDWAEKMAGNANWTHLDISRVAAAGQSCGGMQAMDVSGDSRVRTVGLFNSGLMGNAGGTSGKPENCTKPAFYFMGNTTDILYSAVRYAHNTIQLEGATDSRNFIILGRA
jgi:hypothetical protein